MSWLADIQEFIAGTNKPEQATDRQRWFLRMLSEKEDADPYWRELNQAINNPFLGFEEASDLIEQVMEHFAWLTVHEGHNPMGDPSPFLNDGTRQKDIIARVEYLTHLKNT